MKKLGIFTLCFLLSACGGNSDSRSYPYQNRPHNPLGVPTNPTQDFENTITTSNAQKTGLISNSENQISDYVVYRLNEWNLYNPNIGQDISKGDIATAAAWLTSGDHTASEIETKFADNLTLMHMAAYVVDNRLNSCFNNTSVGSAAACFVKWRNNNGAYYNKISDEIHKYTTDLSAADAEFNSTSGSKIKFILDTDGRITGAKITQGENTTDFENWTNVDTDAQYITTTTMNYDSGGKDLGLSYSDFGTYNIVKKQTDKNTGLETSETVQDNGVFAGGYASQKIDPADIAQNLTFSGRAVGTVSSGDASLNLSGDASVTFDVTSKSSTVSAKFNNWYDVTAKNDGTIIFENNTGNMLPLQSVDATGRATASDAIMNIGYYGENPSNNLPTESVGTIQYTETSSGLKMDMAFGAK